MMNRYRGILVVVGAIGMVWIASLLQLFLAPDGWIYDRTVRMGGWQASTTPSVLMVQTGSREQLSETENLAILEYLLQLGASQVIFLDSAAVTQAGFQQLAKQRGNVIVGTGELRPLAGRISRHQGQQPIIPSGTTSEIQFGALSIPNAGYGIHRQAAASVHRENGQTLLSLAMLAARSAGREPKPGLFKVNFNRGADWIPRVSVDRVRSKGLIPELVSGRAVVIGSSQDPDQPGFYTPVHYDGSGISLLEFQAYAIDTLIQGEPILNTPWSLNLLLLGLIGLINLIVYQWFHLDRSSWFTLTLIGGYLVVGWILLHGFLIWIPVVEIAVAQLLMFWLFVRFKLMQDDQEMRHTVLQRMSKLKNYMLPPDFYNLDEHWAQVITFIDQTLNLNRVILLEKVEGDHRVREVKALRCSLEDIDERRRDFERVPYSDAIAEGGPIKLEKRLFFNNETGSPYDQYLVPLLFAGEVQGFWAFDAAPEEVASSENFLGNIRSFGGQIAELLYHRHRWQQEREGEASVFGRLFRLEAGKASSQEVGDLLSLLDKRLNALQSMFDSLATASIHYDLFGRVVQLNSSMEEFMNQQDLPGYKLTALDLLVRMSGMSQQRARRLLQQIVVDRCDFNIPVKLKGARGENYSLHLKPLKAAETDLEAAETVAPFQLSGILFELRDETGQQKQFEIKEQLLEWMRLRIRNELTTLLEDDRQYDQLLVAAGDDIQTSTNAGNSATAARVEKLETRTTSPSNGRSTSDFYSRATDVLASLERVQSILSTDWKNLTSLVYPVDVYPLLISSFEELRPLLDEKRLSLESKIPRLLGLAGVQPDKLKYLFKALLEVLTADALVDSELAVQVVESGDALHLSFANSGFGIPDEHLQAYIWQPEYGVTEEFKDLRLSVQPVADWGGLFEMHSEVGVGMWAELRLEVLS